jgi:hypothetical protein
MLLEDFTEERAVFVANLVGNLTEGKSGGFQHALGGLYPYSLKIEQGGLAGYRFESPFEGSTAHAETPGKDGFGANRLPLLWGLQVMCARNYQSPA